MRVNSKLKKETLTDAAEKKLQPGDCLRRRLGGVANVQMRGYRAPSRCTVVSGEKAPAAKRKRRGLKKGNVVPRKKTLLRLDMRLRKNKAKEGTMKGVRNRKSRRKGHQVETVHTRARKKTKTTEREMWKETVRKGKSPLRDLQPRASSEQREQRWHPEARKSTSPSLLRGPTEKKERQDVTESQKRPKKTARRRSAKTIEKTTPSRSASLQAAISESGQKGEGGTSIYHLDLPLWGSYFSQTGDRKGSRPQKAKEHHEGVDRSHFGTPRVRGATFGQEKREGTA